VTNIAKNLQIDAASTQIGMHYRMGAGRIMASIAHQNDRSAGNNDATQYAVGYDYNLSKRTDIYTVLAMVKNSNDAQYAPSAASAPGGFVPNAGDTGKAVQVGVRHRF
jgi:predicted porin